MIDLVVLFPPFCHQDINAAIHAAPIQAVSAGSWVGLVAVAPVVSVSGGGCRVGDTSRAAAVGRAQERRSQWGVACELWLCALGSLLETADAFDDEGVDERVVIEVRKVAPKLPDVRVQSRIDPPRSLNARCLAGFLGAVSTVNGWWAVGLPSRVAVLRT